MKFNEKLAKLRQKNALTQEQAAERLNVSPKTVSKWENGGSCPDIFLLPRIAEMYGVTVDDLLSESEFPNERPYSLRIVFREKNGGGQGEITLPFDQLRVRGDKEQPLFTGDGANALKGIRLADVERLRESGMTGKFVAFEDEEDSFEIYLE